ncbi:MAG: hypothetical protein AAFW87_14110 [Pseudomonadota bacterium]
MNANQIINMVIRMVVNRAVRGGVNAGINAVGNRMSKGKGGPANQAETDAPDSAETTKRMRQTLRATKKIGRF